MSGGAEVVPTRAPLELPHMLERLIAFLQAHQLEADPIVRAKLAHEATNTPVATYIELHDLERTARAAWEEASVYASQYRGPAQAFVLRIYRASDPRETIGSFRWMCEADLSDEGTMIPAQVGALETASMLARHLEVTQRTLHSMVTENNKRQNEERDALRARITQLEGERVTFWERWEEANSRTHERNAELLKLERGETRKDQALQTLRMLAPTAAAIVAKKAGVPTAPTTSAEALAARELATSLTPTQLEHIFAGLAPGQRAVLAKLLELMAPPPAEEGNDATH